MVNQMISNGARVPPRTQMPTLAGLSRQEFPGAAVPAAVIIPGDVETTIRGVDRPYAWIAPS